MLGVHLGRTPPKIPAKTITVQQALVTSNLSPPTANETEAQRVRHTAKDMHRGPPNHCANVPVFIKQAQWQDLPHDLLQTVRTNSTFDVEAQPIFLSQNQNLPAVDWK